MKERFVLFKNGRCLYPKRVLRLVFESDYLYDRVTAELTLDYYKQKGITLEMYRVIKDGQLPHLMKGVLECPVCKREYVAEEVNKDFPEEEKIEKQRYP